MKNIMNDIIGKNRFSKQYLPWLKDFINNNFSHPPRLKKPFFDLQQRFNGALHFLRNHSILKDGKNISLETLPWYLVLGTAKSGKTSFLANSSIHYLLGKKRALDKQSIPASATCDWWATRDAVLIDVPGNYTAYPVKIARLSHQLYRYFLGLIKKSSQHCLLDGAIITLSLNDIIDKREHEKLIQYLKYNINLLTSYANHQLTYYLVINKCDLLPGFLDFFAECSGEELAQAWGITLTATTNSNLAKVVNERFNRLIARLNTQLIFRLHQEKNLITKSHIKDFPLQVERLKNTLVEFFAAHHRFLPAFNLRGIYLTSANQKPLENAQTHHYPKVVASNHFQHSLAILREPVSPNRSYFIKQFLLHGLVPPLKEQYFVTKQNKFRLIYSIISFAIIVGAFTWFTHHYN